VQLARSVGEKKGVSYGGSTMNTLGAVVEFAVGSQPYEGWFLHRIPDFGEATIIDKMRESVEIIMKRLKAKGHSLRGEVVVTWIILDNHNLGQCMFEVLVPELKDGVAYAYKFYKKRG
jgi:hypothetical protein